MKELFLEIGTEEIPSGYMPGALKSLEQAASRLLEEARLSFSGVCVYGTSRRIILHVESVQERQSDLSRTVMGPPKRIAFDDNGSPTPAATGFAGSQGTTVDKLTLEKGAKGEYLAYHLREKGAKTKKVLRTVLPKIISALVFPKTMRWGKGEMRFVRPIHRVTALFGGELVKFEIGDIPSGSDSVGHRFMAPRKFVVKDFKSYLRNTAKRYVVIDAREREKVIVKESRMLASRVKGTVLEDAGLLQTLVYLTEYPFPVLGGFEKQYLKLPREVLIAVMKNHQKYLSVVDEKGKLLPYFIAVSDNKVLQPKTIRRGYERVLRARLSDAKYFYDEDSKRPPADYLEGLKSVVWQEKLGSLFDKIKRIRALGVFIASRISPMHETSVSRAVELCKSDLLTRMVYEFPELQGIMGREYARLHKEEREVSEALLEQYLPRFAGDRLPSTVTGAIVSIADKLDTITGCFGVGLIPTGSEDPHALRRQSLGLMNILIHQGWGISLTELIEQAISSYGKPFAAGPDEVCGKIKGFFISRLKNQLVDSGVSFDSVDAVFSVSFDFLPDDIKKVKAVDRMKREPYFESLATAFKRVQNIVKGERYPEPEESLFREPAERALHDCFLSVKKETLKFDAKKDYNAILKKISEMRKPVDRFFDEVLVMDRDTAIKNNRLGLLAGVSGLYRNLADFSKIVV